MGSGSSNLSCGTRHLIEDLAFRGWLAHASAADAPGRPPGRLDAVHGQNRPSVFSYPARSSARTVSNITQTPAARASRSAHSSGAWLLPARQGAKIMAAGQTPVMKAVSCPAPLASSRTVRPSSCAARLNSARSPGSHAAGWPSERTEKPVRLTRASRRGRRSRGRCARRIVSSFPVKWSARRR